MYMQVIKSELKIASLVSWLVVAPLMLIASGLVTASSLEVPQQWQQKLEQSDFSGTLMVATSRQIIFQQGFGESDRDKQRAFDQNTVFDIGSLTKQFTATAIMLLAEQGKLSVSDGIDRYFQSVPQDKRQITVHQLLSNSSGLPTSLPGRGLYDIVSAEDFVTQAFEQPLVAAPGEQYNYSNIGYGLLAQLIEIVSGQSWEEYIRQKILLPAGLKQTGYRQLLQEVSQDNIAINYGADPNWLQRKLGLQAKSRSVGDSLAHLRKEPGRRWFEGAGGFLSTTEDMYAWYLAITSGKILNEESWRQMFEPHIVENAEKNSHYGYGWLVIKNASLPRRITHSGSNGYSYATFDFYPDVELFIFTASNDIDNYPYPLIKELSKTLLKNMSD